MIIYKMIIFLNMCCVIPIKSENSRIEKVAGGTILGQYLEAKEYIDSWIRQKRECIELLGRSGSWIIDNCNICYCAKGVIHCDDFTQDNHPNCYKNDSSSEERKDEDGSNPINESEKDDLDRDGNKKETKQQIMIQREGSCNFLEEGRRIEREEGEVWNKKQKVDIVVTDVIEVRCTCCHGVVICSVD
ncbi:uncharacterized protein LOC111709279 isoform X2 [Eurytemora carolleeae]|uniref:uncharacterized protein LOC111709279 isoform X2 n=1 Tax=Eurytemora carolleeae TaxID=1294199 RepID=UPI000C760F3F|nr:uncharacterized protein LOC111709279 isoform X2 [Eurytemora carolleeae]|eukprot:XP_023338683.1 uncharacterized protein LOC111709279 isoform X2 [Eurytemora affinis]